jgi:hypothetical protein
VSELSGYVFSPLREDDIALYRGSGNGLTPILLVAAEDTSLGSVERLEHEYALKAELDANWATRPVALTYYNDRMTLVLEDPGGSPLDGLLGRPIDVSHFLRIAIPLAAALRQMHERGLIHKDIKPANILVDSGSGGVWLTGFGIASRLPCERRQELHRQPGGAHGRKAEAVFFHHPGSPEAARLPRQCRPDRDSCPGSRDNRAGDARGTLGSCHRWARPPPGWRLQIPARPDPAAYSLIPEEQRGVVHMRIGRALRSSLTAGAFAEHLFDVANQLNRGAALLVDRDERAQVAMIDLRAGRKAKT